MEVPVQCLTKLPLPCYATPQSSGLDLLAAFEEEYKIFRPGEIKIIPTGIKIAIPVGYEGQVRPRSGLAATWGITVLNAPGTIDADYRGEIKVILIHHGQQEMQLDRGMRIAQLVIAPIARINWAPCDALPETLRGSSGLGSTGMDLKPLPPKF
jgi:dUTP pyrophosphatase